MKKQREYREVIIENTSNPSNFVAQRPLNFEHINVYSNACSESYDLFVQFASNGLIKKANWKGHGCLVSKAAINILCTLITNQSVSKALLIIKNYEAMIYHKKYQRSLLKDLVIFQNIANFPNRINCALLGARGIVKLIQKS